MSMTSLFPLAAISLFSSSEIYLNAAVSELGNRNKATSVYYYNLEILNFNRLEY
jgi:hypothetical protein